MASKKKEELLQPEVQTQAQPAAQSTYSAEGLNSRADVEKAMANVSPWSCPEPVTLAFLPKKSSL